jgi:hypothetical protein
VISGREAPVICGGLPRGYPKVYDQSLFRLAQAFFFVDILVARVNHFTALGFHAAWRALCQRRARTLGEILRRIRWIPLMRI